jgi:hypothetical protein
MVVGGIAGMDTKLNITKVVSFRKGTVLRLGYFLNKPEYNGEYMGRLCMRIRKYKDY